MKGDFTRDSFDPSKNFYRVLMQQGRVSLDADWNEQMSILFDRLQCMLADVVGPYGGPNAACGFAIFAGDPDPRNFGIGIGRYYVDGLLCVNSSVAHYRDPGEAELEAGTYLVYLDAWEEPISPLQDPTLTEPALGGIDTTLRTQIRWRVRVADFARFMAPGGPPTPAEMAGVWRRTFRNVITGQPGGLAATAANVDTQRTKAAAAALGGGYHGAENQLYRVEIHQPGTAAGGATFKWSRDNASAAYAVVGADADGVTVGSLGRDARTRLAHGDWVEISDDDDIGVTGAPRPLVEVQSADPSTRKIKLKKMTAYRFDANKHPVLRRWDQGTDALPVVESGDEWTPLEDGIAIRFTALNAAPAGAAPSIEATYARGDYWLIPARTVGGGSIVWPTESGSAVAVKPHGIAHHYAPLAAITLDASGLTLKANYRLGFDPLAE